MFQHHCANTTSYAVVSCKVRLLYLVQDYCVDTLLLAMLNVTGIRVILFLVSYFYMSTCVFR